MDLNHGPSGYEPDELPDCSTPRCGADALVALDALGVVRLANIAVKYQGLQIYFSGLGGTVMIGSEE
jgi:hypothetical protein